MVVCLKAPPRKSPVLPPRFAIMISFRFIISFATFLREKLLIQLTLQVGEFSKRGLSSFTTTGYSDIERHENNVQPTSNDWNWVDDVKSSQKS